MTEFGQSFKHCRTQFFVRCDSTTGSQTRWEKASRRESVRTREFHRSALHSLLKPNAIASSAVLSTLRDDGGAEVIPIRSVGRSCFELHGDDWVTLFFCIWDLSHFRPIRVLFPSSNC